MKESRVARFHLRICQRDLQCHECRERIEPLTLYVSGTSLHPLTGYKGGFFCTDCYLKLNPIKSIERSITMARNRVEELGYGKVSKVSELDIDFNDWDLTPTEILNKPIVILSVQPIETKFGSAYVGQCLVNEKELRVLLSGVVVVRQISKLIPHLPVECKITKQGQAHVLV